MDIELWLTLYGELLVTSVVVRMDYEYHLQMLKKYLKRVTERDGGSEGGGYMCGPNVSDEGIHRVRAMLYA